MKGIYKITNKINNKCYIGKSSDIEKRFHYHQTHYNDSKEFNKTLYKAFRKYGIENFNFEIIEEIKEDYSILSDNKEKYWIQYYNSFNDGYNETLGGDGGITVANPRQSYGKLTTEEVIYLRQRYVECKYPASFIYNKEFSNKISKRGFQAIWLGEKGKEIMPEVFTEENKKKQIQLSRAYEGVLRRRITLEEKIKCKERLKNGETVKQVWQDFKDKYSYGGFNDMINSTSLDERLDLTHELSAL